MRLFRESFPWIFYPFFRSIKDQVAINVKKISARAQDVQGSELSWKVKQTSHWLPAMSSITFSMRKRDN